jgi:hypothetical protein
MTIVIHDCCGDFAENKDIARTLRESIRNTFDNTEDDIVFDFSGVDSTTQSFIHALISEYFQRAGGKALNRLEFKNCSESVKSLVTTVINYSLE